MIEHGPETKAGCTDAEAVVDITVPSHLGEVVGRALVEAPKTSTPEVLDASADEVYDDLEHEPSSFIV
jgi:hypothetical protein